jgi:hypothetical protein
VRGFAYKAFLILAAAAVVLMAIISLSVFLLIITCKWLALGWIVFGAGFGAGFLTASVFGRRSSELRREVNERGDP